MASGDIEGRGQKTEAGGRRHYLIRLVLCSTYCLANNLVHFASSTRSRLVAQRRAPEEPLYPRWVYHSVDAFPSSRISVTLSSIHHIQYPSANTLTARRAAKTRFSRFQSITGPRTSLSSSLQICMNLWKSLISIAMRIAP